MNDLICLTAFDSMLLPKIAAQVLKLRTGWAWARARTWAFYTH